MKKMHRFFIEGDIHQPTIPIIDRENIHQMRDVLRLQDGEQVILCDGTGEEAVVRLGKMETVPLGTVEEVRWNMVEPPVQVTLFCAVLKREHFEFVVQKSVELGVYTIVPVLTERTIKLGVKGERLQKISKEAAEVAGRGIIPAVQDPLPLKDAIATLSSFNAAVCFDPEADTTLSVNQDAKRIALFVGPEGGWSEAEQKMFIEAGSARVRLGPRILRGETAAMTGLAVLMAMIEGWG